MLVSFIILCIILTGVSVVVYTLQNDMKTAKALFKAQGDDITRIKKAMQNRVSIDSKSLNCVNCGEPLPINAVRQANGLYLCARCKVK